MRELQFSGGIIEIAGESSREKKERGTQIDTRGRKKKKDSQDAETSCSKDDAELCRGIKTATTRVARVRIWAKIRSPEGERSEFMAGGVRRARNTHSAHPRA